jgi:hypothetical protein
MMNHSPRPEEITALCMQLFDSFCERRSVLPLAYLMHAWPLTEANEKGFRMLRQSLRDLSLWHAAEIEGVECLLIGQILSTLAASAEVTADESEHGVARTLETYVPGTRH